MKDGTINVLGISGSLRGNSFNTAALRAARLFCPDGMTVEQFDLDLIPPYNEDVKLKGFPQPVQELREKIRAADALLIATPEYNYSIPGVLKNAIDWASRPPEQPFDGKAVAVMSASQGAFGGVRAQHHLRQSLVFLNAFFVNKPEVMIASAQTKFDVEGRLTDTPTIGFIRDLLVSLGQLARQLQK